MTNHRVERVSLFTLIICIAIFFVGTSCSSNKSAENEETTTTQSQPEAPVATSSEAGVGPVSSVTLEDAIDEALVAKGKAAFESKCTACHIFDNRMIGPALAGVTVRRNPAWIMNMIINPQVMTEKDPIAKQLLADYGVQMVAQNVDEPEARAILEYLRDYDQKNPSN